jgi:hypothetical protein
VTEWLRVEVPDPDSAISLVDELRDLHAELVPLEDSRCEVQIELEDDRERQVLAALDAVERWLAGTGIEATSVKLGDQSFLVERRAGPVTAAGRAERVAKNEVLCREVNERIGQAAERAAFEGPTVFVCECGDRACSEAIEVTLTEYETARSRPTLFLVAPGHETAEFEHVVEQNERFAVVEKAGAAEAIARRHDPRA